MSPDRAGGSLVRWFREQDLLRGPFLFVDYWANTLGLGGISNPDHVRDGFVDPALFRLGVDRPDLELPRLGSYLLLFLVGPFLFAFRSFRRIGRYRMRFGSRRGERVQEALRRYELSLDPAGSTPAIPATPVAGPDDDDADAPGTPEPATRRVDVRLGDRVLARDVLNPFRVAGFSSLFWAANKLPLASLMGLVVVGVMAPLLSATGLLDITARYWIPIGFPLLVAVLYLLFREFLTALLGGVPVLLGTYLVGVLRPSTPYDWSVFFWALAGIFLVYLLADWFFVPRPVPPVLLLYTRDEPGNPYVRDDDAPWWLEGRTYWVWRYLLLSPAEINKFWERDWERVDLWIRADGPDAGSLEWVVTDLHYRELWVPYEKLGPSDQLERQREKAIEAAGGDEVGIWLVEVDADLVFHSPMFRGVTFMRDTGGVPVRGISHVLRSLWTRVKDDDVAEPMRRLDRVRLEQGLDLLSDIPEVIIPRAEERLVEEPWTYWRYPLGAATRREPKLYGIEPDSPPPPVADRSLQIKAP